MHCTPSSPPVRSGDRRKAFRPTSASPAPTPSPTSLTPRPPPPPFRGVVSRSLLFAPLVVGSIPLAALCVFVLPMGGTLGRGDATAAFATERVPVRVWVRVGVSFVCSAVRFPVFVLLSPHLSHSLAVSLSLCL
eukprot:RCo009896